MKKSRKCSECGGREIFWDKVDASGGYGPDLLPHVGNLFSLWKEKKFEVYVCGSCGYYQFFVADDGLPQVREKFDKYQ